jgi:hypothetical protein
MASSFYTYHQNNSGGYYKIDYKAGIGNVVIIEDDNYKQANSKAVKIGLYFDGDGDCSCCGNRWSDKWDEYDATDKPEIYGESVEGNLDSWLFPVFIHYKNGQVKLYDKKSVYLPR